MAETCVTPDNGDEAVLRVKDLRIGFRRSGGVREVVHGIDFELRRGEVLAVVGESGSGKTVAGLSMVRLLPSNAVVDGEIWLGGQDLLAMSEKELRGIRGDRIALIFQDPAGALDPVFTVGYQLEEAIRQHHPELGRAEVRARAVELLDVVGIPEPQQRLRFYPHQFSGGQCQRIMIAMAISCDPDVLIADEPTTALDVSVQQEILDVMLRLKESLGTAVMFITHDMGVVADVADRVVVMKEGLIQEEGPSDLLFAQPRADYTKALLAAVPRLGETEAREAPPASDRATLEVRDLMVTYPGKRGQVKAVDGVSFEIARGEVLGLVGESGSGKSTIGRAVLGIAPVESGCIEFMGQDISAARGRVRRQMQARTGTVFQNPGGTLNPRFTIGEILSEPLTVHRGVARRAARDRVRELLADVDLPSAWVTRYPHELSGGQRQRVSIARAIALEPELIIADEPTSALDVSVQATVLDLLQRLQAEHHFACLFITHDLAVVDRLCHRVAVLNRGRMEELGDRDSVLRQPRSEYTKRLLASAPVPDPVAQRARRRERMAAAS